MLTSKFSKGESYASTPQSEPTPLFGILREAEPVPREWLGPLTDSIRAVATLIQAPEAIAMQSVLIVSSAATQALADVETLQGHVPLSCFALTVAQSGERKSACDSLATGVIEQIDQERARKYRHDRRKFEADKLEFQKGKRRKRDDDFIVVNDELKAPDPNLPPEPPLFSGHTDQRSHDRRAIQPIRNGH
ncbi:MAG: DUF3987 domain-containing protein, partial [Sneathiella sp.]